LEEIPFHNSVENRIKKSGYSIYNNPELKSSQNYGMIIDESIMLGNERMLLSLGVTTDKTTDTPLGYGDIEVIGIHVDSRWDASKITTSLRLDEKKTGRLKIEKALSDCSYLLPPRQRSIARFMNFWPTISRARKMLDSFHIFTEKEKHVYH
jgi:hypothetical protein